MTSRTHNGGAPDTPRGAAQADTTTREDCRPMTTNPMSTPAQELHAAAKVLRETAQTGPWDWTCDDNGTQVYDRVGMVPLGAFVADCRNPAVAKWVALASPALAVPIAAWLESWDGIEFTEHGAMNDDLQYALNLARAINGSAS